MCDKNKENTHETTPYYRKLVATLHAVAELKYHHHHHHHHHHHQQQQKALFVHTTINFTELQKRTTKKNKIH